MTYDSACYNLAESFLKDHYLTPLRLQELSDRLAQAIQQTIEDFEEEELTYFERKE